VLFRPTDDPADKGFFHPFPRPVPGRNAVVAAPASEPMDSSIGCPNGRCSGGTRRIDPCRTIAAQWNQPSGWSETASPWMMART